MATIENESRIRALAHQFWEEEGRPLGMDREHWRRARERVEAEEDQKLSPETGQSADGRDGYGAAGDGMVGGDPDGAQSGQTKEQVFLKSATRVNPD